ncbi:MAG: hypothetical protein UEP31_09700, partial [Anaerovoracaceae bacterium]|nr:hypothetical protein [Anaerovoracaceae bacterium]
SQDSALIEAFNEGADIHSSTASKERNLILIHRHSLELYFLKSWSFLQAKKRREDIQPVRRFLRN